MLIADAERMEKRISAGGGVDKYMDVSEVEDVMGKIERQYSIDIEQSKGDNKKKLQRLASKDRYKAMKELDKNNERASPK